MGAWMNIYTEEIICK